MQIGSLMLALGGLLGLTGCSDLVSLEPFATEQQAVIDPNLAGTWKSTDKDLYIVQLNGSEYTISYTDGKDGIVKFTGMLLKAGDAEILDLAPSEAGVLQVPVHAAVRVWTAGNELRWKFLDSKWLRDQAGPLLATREIGHGDSHQALLTAPGEAVHNFLLKYGADAKAIEGETQVLTRVP